MNGDLAWIKHNLETVMENVSKAAERSGRARDEVKLVVVTKSQPVERIEVALQSGARILGENYPEEAVEKIRMLGSRVREWHMIGHLQSRKAAMVASQFHYFQALDSLRLAEKLNGILVQLDKTLPVLLEVNIGDEASKYGWSAGQNRKWDGLRADIERMTSLNHLHIKGLMVMPPLGLTPEAVRPYFSETRYLLEKLRQEFPIFTWQELSMGTSTDYEAAVQDGATFIRVGQAIFGPRQKKG